MELARTFKVYARFLGAEREFSQDEAVRKDADAMDRRADQIFARLKISSIGLEPAPFFGGKTPSRPPPSRPPPPVAGT